VVDADVALNLPDFRAAERTFDLLTQGGGAGGTGAAGGPRDRADPGAGPSAIVHASSTTCGASSRRSWSSGATRPTPHVRLANVVLSGKDERLVARAADGVGAWLRALLAARPDVRATVLGPAPCPIERVRDRWRWHVLVKAADDGGLTRLAGYLAARAPVPGGARLVVDRDPASLLLGALLNSPPAVRIIRAVHGPSARSVSRSCGGSSSVKADRALLAKLPADGSSRRPACSWEAATGSGGVAVSDAVEQLLAALDELMPRDEVEAVYAFPPVRHDGREHGVAVVSRVMSGERRLVYRARYVVPLKGPDRGKVTVAVEETAEAPAALLPEVLGSAARADEAGEAEPVDLTAWKAGQGERSTAE